MLGEENKATDGGSAVSDMYFAVPMVKAKAVDKIRDRHDIERMTERPYTVDWLLRNVYRQDYGKIIKESILTQPEKYGDAIPSGPRNIQVLDTYYKKCRTLLKQRSDSVVMDVFVEGRISWDTDTPDLRLANFEEDMPADSYPRLKEYRDIMFRLRYLMDLRPCLPDLLRACRKACYKKGILCSAQEGRILFR